MELLENLEPYLRTFWIIALITSLIFVIQTIMTFTGMDAHDGTHADFNGDFADGDSPFQLFSLRNLINFLLGFSWSGIAFYEVIESKTALITIAVGVGLLFVYLFFVIIRQLMKLTESNSFQLADAVGKTADVYLSIPENKSGKGKILISVKGSTHELDAMTENEKISSGSPVKVVRIEGEGILMVEKI